MKRRKCYLPEHIAALQREVTIQFKLADVLSADNFSCKPETVHSLLYDVVSAFRTVDF